MKKFTTLFLLGMFVSNYLWSQSYKNDNLSPYEVSFTAKPANFSLIHLNYLSNGLGLHFGIEMEKVLPQIKNTTLVMPISYGVSYGWHTPNMGSNNPGFSENGYKAYAAPGFKYYFDGFQKTSGWAASAHLLAGIGYQNFISIPTTMEFDERYIGLLANLHYRIPLNYNWGINLETGFGYIYTLTLQNGYYTNTDRQTIKVQNLKLNALNPIANVSIGLNYRF